DQQLDNREAATPTLMDADHGDTSLKKWGRDRELSVTCRAAESSEFLFPRRWSEPQRPHRLPVAGPLSDGHAVEGRQGGDEAVDEAAVGLRGDLILLRQPCLQGFLVLLQKVGRFDKRQPEQRRIAGGCGSIRFFESPDRIGTARQQEVAVLQGERRLHSL